VRRPAFAPPAPLPPSRLHPAAPARRTGRPPAPRARAPQAVLRRATRRVAAPQSQVSSMSDTPPDAEPEPSQAAPGESAEAPAVSDELQDDLTRAVTGRGEEGCEQCTGVGSVACPVCSAKGFLSISMMETVSATQCRLCRGRCVIPCPTCRSVIFKSVVWWDLIPSEEDDPEEKWRTGPDGRPRMPWSPPPAG
jgi:hypothetical protein